MYVFGCGVEFDHFNRAQDPTIPIPPDIDFMQRPILGWIGVVRDLDGLAVELSIPDRDRTPEGLELSARVLDVVLALHPRASELED